MKILRDMKYVIFITIMTALFFYKAGKNQTVRDQEEKIFTLESDLRTAKIDLQYAEHQAYSDCQQMMQTNARIQKVDGCMMTIEKLCTQNTVKDSESCMKTFMPVCSRLDL